MTAQGLTEHPALPNYLHSLSALLHSFALASSPQERLLLSIDFVVRDHSAVASGLLGGPGEFWRGGRERDVVGSDGPRKGELGEESVELALVLLEQPLAHKTTAVEAALTLLLPLARLLPSPKRHRLVVHLKNILSLQGGRYGVEEGGVAELAAKGGLEIETVVGWLQVIS